MSVEQYNLVANDWLNLEYIINDLTQRVIGQELHPTSSPTFGDIAVTDDLGVGGDLDVTDALDVGGTVTLDDLTASRIVATDAAKGLVSINLVDWVAGTTDEVDIADDGTGGVVISSPLTGSLTLLDAGTSDVSVDTMVFSADKSDI